MASTQHEETHFQASDVIRDVVIGMSDGLTVPFALAAGLSGAVSTTTLVVTAGIAEIAAGSIAMGLGGYLAARTDREHYASELAREQREIVDLPDREKDEVAEVFQQWGLTGDSLQHAVQAVTSDKDRWANFMMRYELGLEEPEPKRARNSSLTIGVSYIVGGIIPLLPYMLVSQPSPALLWSVVVTLIALFIFGYVKGRFTGTTPVKSALQTALVGSVAAGVAFLVAKWVA